jgi:GNAT superfamily N-acetyltransferase
MSHPRAGLTRRCRLQNARIREFQESDLVHVRRLIHQTIDVCYSGVYPSRAVQFFKEFHSEEKIMERHRKGEILVVEQDGDVIATGSIVGNDIFGVFVHPEFQHRGHGGALMRELENRAKARGFTESELNVSLPSRGFYKSLGYEMLEECSMDMGEGQHLDFWKAKKPLKWQES